ncbi:MAG TPA: LamG domain-containing protein, partial [Verrucomicrobiota bacterium]|nr:LamG domain-containing protein [Verrucomicrobiota bacterium]
MKLQSTPKLLLTLVVTLIVTFQAATPVSAALTDGLVAYWPLDEITGCNNRTPEVVNGYDLQPYFGGAHILTNFGPDTVYLTNDAVRGNAFFWPNPANGNNRSLLGFISTSTNDLVPVNRYSPTNFTVSFWVKTDNTKNDIRIWTEGNINNNNPGIDIGATGSSWDFFQRQQGLGAPFLEQGDNHTLGGLIAFEFEPTWHNITLVQEGNDPATNTAVRRIYVDGMLDPIPLPNKNPGLWDLNTVAVGGWLRAGVAATVSMFNGAIDEVAVWSRALSEEEIAQYIAEGITNEFTTTAPLQIAFFESDLGLIDHGDSVTLTWNASPDVTGLFIDNGVGDVLPVSTC